MRSFDVQGIGLQPTGRTCDNPKCKGPLRDCLLDWDDELPEKELRKAEQQSKKADLILCLGTSLRVQPANKLPLNVLHNDGSLVISLYYASSLFSSICNLQPTPLDNKATIKLHADCGTVMRQVMQALRIPIPIYKQKETFMFKSTKQEKYRVFYS